MSLRVTGPVVLIAVGLLCALFWDDALAPLLSFEGGDEASTGGDDLTFLDEGTVNEPDAPTLRALGDKRAHKSEARGDSRKAVAVEPQAGQPGSARFRGGVVDAAGVPVSGVHIRLVGPGGSFDVTTGADGGFEIEVPPGRYTATIQGDRRGARAAQSIVVGADTGTGEPLTVELAPPSALEVRVLRLDDAPKDGKPPEVLPVPDAVVVVTDVETESLRQEATTGSQGVALFEGLVPGAQRVEVRVGEGALLIYSAETVAEQREMLEVRMPQNVPLEGTVRVGADGPVVGGAHIEILVASTLSTARYRSAFESAYNGTFDVQLPQGRIVSVAVKAEGFAPWPSVLRHGIVVAGLRKLAGERALKMDVALEPGIAVPGVVRDPEQQPLADILLRLVPPRGEAVSATTDPNGAYRFEGLAPGIHGLSIETPGWYLASRRDRTLRVELGMTNAYAHPDLLLAPARTLQGRIRDATGEPVAGARVWLVSGTRDLIRPREAGGLFESFSDATGAWVISDIPPALHATVRAASDGREAVPVPVLWSREGPTTIDLGLAPTALLRGRLVDANTGEGVPGVDVLLEPVPRDGRTLIRAQSDDAGGFTASGLIPGRWHARPVSADHLKSAGAEVNVGATTPAEISITLDPGIIFAGVCVDEDDGALPWVKVYLQGRLDGGPKIIQRTLNASADGAFHAGGFRPGTYMLRAMLAGYRATELRDLRGGDLRLRIVLKKR